MSGSWSLKNVPINNHLIAALLKSLQRKCFPLNFIEFFKTSLLKNTSWQMFLFIMKNQRCLGDVASLCSKMATLLEILGLKFLPILDCSLWLNYSRKRNINWLVTSALQRQAYEGSLYWFSDKTKFPVTAVSSYKQFPINSYGPN